MFTYCRLNIILFFVGTFFAGSAQSNLYQSLAQQLLLATKTSEPATFFLQQIADANPSALLAELPADADKKAFWINLYNAFTQYELSRNAAQYTRRRAFFKAKLFTVAGRKISLNQIEHGLLRRHRSIISLGYWGTLFPTKFTTTFMVDTIDFRIHFALNCGAKSCPPIAFYTPQKINQQLNLAMGSYLSTYVEITDPGSVARVPKMMSWFRGDFGGKKGILNLLKQHDLLQADSHAHIKFLPYNWTLNLSAYQ